MAISIIKKSLVLLPLLLFAFSLASEAQASTLARPSNNLGLVGYWAFDEATSSTATDYSGRGNTGSITGTPNWVPGKHGSALDLVTANSNGVNLGTPASLNITSSFTVLAWIKPRSGGGSNFGRIFDKTDAGSSGFRFLVDNSTVTNGLNLTTNGSGGVVSSANALKLNQWQLVAVTYTTGTNAVVLYVNGVSVGSGSVTAPASSAAVTAYIGRRASDTTRNYDGAIDDVRVYTRALSVAEIGALYKSGEVRINSVQGSTITNGLVGRWTFDGGAMNWTSATAGTAYDISGAGNNGTLTNMSRSLSSVIGKIGQGVWFDGSNDTISLNSKNGFATGSGASWSIAGWAKPDAITGIYLIASYGDGSTNGASPHIAIASSKWRVSCWGGVNDKDVTSPTPVVGQWDYIVGTYDGTNIRGYIDGVLAVGPVTATCAPVTTRARIGASPVAAASSFFSGSLDDVRIYNRQLTDAEVATLYRETSPNKINSSSATLGGNGTLNQGLAALWTFDGADTSDKIYDRVGGHDGYIGPAGPATSSMKTIGKMGQGLFFNGTTAYVRRAVFGSQPTSQMTLCAWVKTTALADQIILNINRSSTNIVNEGIFEVKSTGGIRFWDHTGAAYGFTDSVDSSATVNDGNWHLACFVKNATSGTYYVDGASSGTKTAANNVSYGSADWVIGTNYRDGDTYFKGSMDDVRVYNRALSASEILQLYNMGK